MSIDEVLMEAITPIVKAVFPNQCNEKVKEYAVFSYIELPADFADDAPQAVKYLVQVHWFLPTGQNPSTRKGQIKRAIAQRGCTYPSVTNASDREGQHYVFECEYLEGLDDGR